MASIPLNAEVLRARALQCRHLAGGLRDIRIADRLLVIALDYEDMARRNQSKLSQRLKNVSKRREHRAAP